MADITPVPASVRIFTPVTYEMAKSGEALENGDALYLDATTDQYKLAKSDTKEHAAMKGFAFTPTAGADEYFALVRSGTVGLGAALPIGVPVIVSATAGKLCPAADAVAGWWVTVVGIPETADKLPINYLYSTAAKV